jgi:hypothetical protein
VWHYLCTGLFFCAEMCLCLHFMCALQHWVPREYVRWYIDGGPLLLPPPPHRFPVPASCLCTSARACSPPAGLACLPFVVGHQQGTQLASHVQTSIIPSGAASAGVLVYEVSQEALREQTNSTGAESRRCHCVALLALEGRFRASR